MLKNRQVKLANNHAFTLCGRRLPMGALYWRDGNVYYLLSDLRPFYAQGGRRLDLVPDAIPMAKTSMFTVFVLEPQADRWKRVYYPTGTSFYRYLQRHMLDVYPDDSTACRTVSSAVHDRRVAPYTKRPNWGQYEHRSRYNCTEQRVPTALIGTGVKCR